MFQAVWWGWWFSCWTTNQVISVQVLTGLKIESTIHDVNNPTVNKKVVGGKDIALFYANEAKVGHAMAANGGDFRGCKWGHRSKSSFVSQRFHLWRTAALLEGTRGVNGVN